AMAGGAAAGPVHLLRQPHQPSRYRGDLVGAGAAPARHRAPRGRARLLGQAGPARLAVGPGSSRHPDRPAARIARCRPAGAGARCTRPGRLAGPVSRRHPQQRAAAAEVQGRPVQAGQCVSARRAGAGLPRHAASQPAQGRTAAPAAAAVLQRQLRRAAGAVARRKLRRFPRARPRRGGGDGMSPQTRMLYVFSGIVALLLVASIIGWLLSRRGPDGGGAGVRNLNARVRAWWGMVGVLGACFAIGPVATLVVFAFISFFALREFITLTPTRAGDHLPLVAAFYLLIPIQYWLIFDQWYGLFAIFIPVYAFLALPVLAVFGGDTTDFLERSTKVQWGVMVAIYCISHAPALVILRPGVEGQLLLLYLMLVVQISDVMQYVFGKLLGRRKLAPVVSPSKTVEGLVG